MKHHLNQDCIVETIDRKNAELCERHTCSCYHSGEFGCTKRICAEESFVNEDGQTRLHLLCQDRCCSVDETRRLIIAFPGALQRRDVYGRPPLFYALKWACSVEVTTLLFDSFPDAILFKDFCGDTPLYLLYHPSKDYRILQHVLTEMPFLAVYMENTFSGQPLVKRVCAPWTSKHLALTKLDVETNAALKDRWRKLVLTIQAAHAHSTGQKHVLSTEMPELHVALEYSCPPLVLSFFAEMYPEQVSMLMTKEKCYPLHYFLSRSDITQDSKSAVRSLIAVFPQAINHRSNGRLPIHLAISHGRKWDDGIQEIVYAGPNNLDCVDPDCSLVPFLQAASLECPDLSTIYSILRENPAVIATLP